MSTLFTHQPHPSIEEWKSLAPTKVKEQLPHHSGATRFNSWLAVKITSAVGTMWCADAFALLALISLPDAVLHEAMQIQKHPEAQDLATEKILATGAVPKPAASPPGG
jgi:hypothetical protein